ncbi:MAG: hypothetical protein LBH59_00410 [Planctomycetaceae bacterium]|nr:hypothetical protein [Planctomycetaceae bacterium]
MSQQKKNAETCPELTHNNTKQNTIINGTDIPKPVWAVGFALEQTLRDATLPVFSFLI